MQEFPKSTDLIQGQLNRISEIVKQMLEFGREPIKKRITIFDLRTVVQSVLILAEGTFKQQKIRFIKSCIDLRCESGPADGRWNMCFITC